MHTWALGNADPGSHLTSPFKTSNRSDEYVAAVRIKFRKIGVLFWNNII